MVRFLPLLFVCSHVKLWRIEGSILLELIDHTDVIRDLNFAPDASLRLVSASRDGTLRVWQLHNGRLNGSVSGQRAAVRLLIGGQSKWMYGCSWSPDANLLASVGDNRSVRLFIYHTCLYFRLYPKKKRPICYFLQLQTTSASCHSFW